jgi:hypothetical protein
MNLTPLALAALYAYAKGQDQPDNNIPGAAPAAPPAATPVAPAATPVVNRTDNTQIMGANQDAEDMEAGKAAAPTVAPASKPTAPVKKKPVAPAASNPAGPSQAAVSDAELMDAIPPKPTYNPPDARLTNLKNSLQWKAATTAMRQQMLNNMGMDPALANETPTKRVEYSKDANGKILGSHVVENKKGGSIKAYAKGGAVSASKRGDGIARKGFTKGVMR